MPKSAEADKLLSANELHLICHVSCEATYLPKGKRFSSCRQNVCRTTWLSNANYTLREIPGWTVARRPREHFGSRPTAVVLASANILFAVVDHSGETIGGVALDDVVEAMLGQPIADEQPENHVMPFTPRPTSRG